MNEFNVIVGSEEFAKLIKKARKSKKLSQRKLSEKIGVSNSTICRWEKGNMEDYDIKNLYKATKVLGLNFYDVIAILLPGLKEDYEK